MPQLDERPTTYAPQSRVVGGFGGVNVSRVLAKSMST
jgi:hypothetical protein